MKKLLALFMAAFMVLSLCAVASVAEEPVNVAPKATYEVHDFYQQQNSSPWGWSDDPADTVYGDETGKDLTDGKHATTEDGKTPDPSYNNTAWVGMSIKHPNAEANGQYILFKLDKVYNVGTIVITVNNVCVSGIAAPASITAYHSDNGTDYKGGVAGAYTAELVTGGVATYKIELNQKTQYIKFDYLNSENNTWMFTDEVEIYATEESGSTTPSKPTTTTIDLLGMLGEAATTEGGGGSITANTLENGTLTVTGSAGWPTVTYPFTSDLTVDIANTKLVLEATIEGGDGCIRLLGANDGTESDDIYLHHFVGGTLDNGSGDLKGPATLSLDIPFEELAFCNYEQSLSYAGKIPFTTDTVDFSQLQVVSVNGSTVKITKLQLVVTNGTDTPDQPDVPATGDNGIVALVVLAAVAMFGSAVVIKSRY